MCCRFRLDVNSLSWQPTVQILNYVCLKEMICCNSEHSTCVTSVLPRQQQLIAQAGIRYWSEQGAWRQCWTGSDPLATIYRWGGGVNLRGSFSSESWKPLRNQFTHHYSAISAAVNNGNLMPPLPSMWPLPSFSLEHLESSRPIHRRHGFPMEKGYLTLCNHNSKWGSSFKKRKSPPFKAGLYTTSTTIYQWFVLLKFSTKHTFKTSSAPRLLPKLISVEQWRNNLSIHRYETVT